jgi:hypothetical protein
VQLISLGTIFQDSRNWGWTLGAKAIVKGGGEQFVDGYSECVIWSICLNAADAKLTEDSAGGYFAVSMT